MTRVKRKKRWKVVEIVAVACVLGAAIGVWWEMEEGKRFRNELRAKERQWRELKENEALTDEGVAAIEADVAARAEEIERLWRASRLGRTERGGAGTLRAEEAFFELAGFVDRTRKWAVAESVRLKEDERFGFAEFAKAGPEREHIEKVMRQRKIAETVLLTVIESGAEEIVGCERSRGSGNERGRWETDTFSADPRWSLEEADELSVLAYRVRFVGRTEVLREVLNRLANVKAPLAVTTVEVEALPEEAEKRGVARSGRAEFSVTVESLEWVEGGKLAGMERSGVAAETVDLVAVWWGGTAGGGAVFTPPEIFYDAVSGRWRAKRSEVATERGRIQNLDTLAVVEDGRRPEEPELFRVQLVGFFEMGEKSVGGFEDGGTTGVVLASAGTRLPELDVAIETLVVERAKRIWPDSMAVSFPVAKAKVRDERSGEVIWLTSAERARRTRENDGGNEELVRWAAEGGR